MHIVILKLKEKVAVKSENYQLNIWVLYITAHRIKT
jgi:hypothetical protein